MSVLHQAHQVKAHAGVEHIRLPEYIFSKTTERISTKFVTELLYKLWFASAQYDPDLKPGVHKYSNFLDVTPKF